MTPASKILAFPAVLALAGCNLSEPANHFAFQELVVIWTDTDSPEDLGPDEAEEDLAPPPPPNLVITELLIETTRSQTGLGELGEYIEIKNVGEGPADPRFVSFVIVDPESPDVSVGRIQVARATSQEEVQVVAGLREIAPGDYFVFVRHELPDALMGPETGPGRYYDYGRYAAGPSLPNDFDRVIEVRYADGLQVDTFDRVRWRQGEIRPLVGDGPGLPYPEDVAIGVRKDAEDSVSNDLPENWCLVSPLIGEGPIRGTPGAVSQCE